MQAQAVDKERQHLQMFQQQYQELLEHHAALQQLVSRAPLWPGVFNSLANAVSKNIVLSRFSATFDPQKPDMITLEGHVLPSASDFDDDLAMFLSSLNASPFFKRVNILNARANRAETTLGSFEIQCELIY